MSDYITDLAGTMAKYDIPEEAFDDAAETLQAAEEFIFNVTFGFLSL